MGNNDELAVYQDFSEELVHLSRLALAGRSQDIQLYIKRLISKLQRQQPQNAEKLLTLLKDLPTLQAPLRSENSTPLPVDLETRLQLARIEHPVLLEVEPIWNSELEKILNQVIAERENEEQLLKANLFPARSVLFTGPPGVGKTLAAKWLSKRLNKPLVLLDLAAVMSSFLGRTGNNVRNVLDYAKEIKGILLLDEFDAVAKRRDDSTEIGELKRLVTVLLQEIDDWPSSGLLIAATNHPDLLDPAIWRRFEVTINFPFPSEPEILKAVRQYFPELKNHAELPIEILSKFFSGMSFSDIERDLVRARKELILQNQSIEFQFQNIMKERSENLSKHSRLAVASELMKSGYSQRKSQELTGVSRDTIRKAQKGKADA